ncbi:hypothetical protein CNMCM7691_003198 [Aspergillus felis]|uniref:Major facilitator superfamily (MFS) profile domain-containing protein n=1 Tax=Aspergillus felis TaxID=1287682 RepID=A0A8H6R145_9EURO|nr:hypothetical protein CNMCM7691_003198 [Aspergillus felis]
MIADSADFPENPREHFIIAAQATKQAITTAILELGAWVGTLTNGYLADAIDPRATTILAVAVFIVA